MQPAAGGGKSVATKSDEVLILDERGEEIVEIPRIVVSEVVGDREVIANAMAATANASSLELASDIQGEEIEEIPKWESIG